MSELFSKIKEITELRGCRYEHSVRNYLRSNHTARY